MRLSFGIHKGQDIADIDLTYLKWLEEQSWIKPDLRSRLQFEISRREGNVTSLGRDVKKNRER